MPDAIVARVPASPEPGAEVPPAGPAAADGAATPPVLTDEMRAKLLGAYKRMLLYQFFGAVALVVLLGCGLLAIYLAAQWAEKIPLLLIATLTGMLGAFFSALTRLYKVDGFSVAMISPTVSELGNRIC